MSCENCGREIKNYGVFLGGVRCPNYCGLKREYSFNIYLLNFAWEGFCRSNDFDSYEVAPFNSDEKQFAQYWWDKIMDGGKFESVGYCVRPKDME